MTSRRKNKARERTDPLIQQKIDDYLEILLYELDVNDYKINRLTRKLVLDQLLQDQRLINNQKKTRSIKFKDKREVIKFANFVSDNLSSLESKEIVKRNENKKYIIPFEDFKSYFREHHSKK